MVFFLTSTVRRSFHRKDFKWKKCRGTGLFSEKTEAFHAELNERAVAAASSYSAAVDFLQNIFIPCLWLKVIRRSDQGVSFKNFPSHIFFSDINHGYRAAILKKSSLWLLPSYMAVVTSCYYEKVRRTMRAAIVSYLLKSFLFFVFIFVFWSLNCNMNALRHKYFSVELMFWQLFCHKM